MEKLYLVSPCRKFFFSLVIAAGCLIFPSAILAQTETTTSKTVTGNLKDATTGQPLEGATIAVKGGSQSTSSDAKGAFSISVPGNNAILVFSFVGYTTQEFRVGDRTSFEISLQSNAGELEQVAVVGYGTQKKKDVTGAVKSVRAEDFNKGIVNSPQQLLQGKVSGVNVTSVSGEPGVAQGITIRGPGSVRSTSSPLFVIDGIPMDNALTGRGDPLNFINPQDIESMDVLKDASATAIYGARGANGVVLITTKKGKAGASMLNFSSSVGFSNLARALPVFSADEFRVEVPKVGGILDDKGGSTDWQEIATRTGITQDYNLSLSGGANKLTYYASFGLQKQQGIIKENDLDRYSGRFNVSQKFWDDRLTIDVNLAVSQTNNDRPPFTTIIGDAISSNPTYPAYDANGNPAVYLNLNNPLVTVKLEREFSRITRIVGNLSPSLRIMKGLVFKMNLGIDNANGVNDIQSLPSTVPVRLGRLETIYNYNRNKLYEYYLTYSYQKGEHNATALGGYSYQKIFLQGRSNSINNFPTLPIEPQYNPSLGQLLDLTNNRPGGFAIINELQSFFGRLTYQYAGKYLATVNFRADGSTKFGENNKYGYFPSFSLGWVLTEEEFLKSSPFTQLKLRGGWGRTGNQEVLPKFSHPLFTASTGGGVSYPLYPTGPYPAGIAYVRLANPDLQWETSDQTDIGLDFSLANGALTGTIDAFNKVSSNILLLMTPADPIQPASSTYMNVPDMTITNKGIELDLQYRHNVKDGISYNIGGNITFLKNEVQNSPYTVISSGNASGPAGLTSATINGYLNGEPVGTFYLREYLGIGPDSLSRYTDIDKDGVITDKDRIAAGTALPDMLYSLYGGISYKGFDLNINFNGVSGNKIYDFTANTNFIKVRLAKNSNTTREAIAEPTESINNPAQVSTRYLKSGAFVRLNNLTLGYNFNTRNLGFSQWVNNLRLSVTGQNLFVITDYDGYDPEVNADRNISDVTSYGIDYLSYPKAKSIVFSLQLSF
ncbi:MAG TPA: TonB-dependent receptor [Chitinophagaceae bacterium]|nr:TonB-dependent receptor [Chitinophagaceae bacterium]